MSNQPRNTGYQQNRSSDAFPVGILIPAFLGFLALFWPLMVWHGCKYGMTSCGAGSDWTWTGQTWAACGIWWGLIVTAVAIGLADSAAKKKGPRRARPPKGRLHVEAVPAYASPSLPFMPQPPLCLHRNAYQVDSLVARKLGGKEILACWCPDCETGLPAAFRYACCGGEPGELSGNGHMYNCPHAAR